MMIQITLVTMDGESSETIPVESGTTTIKDLLELAMALLPLNAAGGRVAASSSFVLVKDGKPIHSAASLSLAMTIQDAGIKDGDLIMVAPSQPRQPQQQQQSTPSAGMDFTNLLQSQSQSYSQQPTSSTSNNASSSSSGLDFSQLLNATTNATTTSANNAQKTVTPVYYPGMNLQEAQQYNPHPEAFVRVLLDHEHLRKELNYYSPKLAQQLFSESGLSENREAQVKRATEIWRNEMIKGGIESAYRATQQFVQEKSMKERLASNPNDVEARQYFQKQENQKLILEQYRTVHEEYPESFSNIVMLYVEAKINGHTVQAFCDSGAQSTIMSHKLARSVGLADLIDERFHGTAIGVGSTKILGKIWIVQLQLGNYFFPCSVTVLEDPPEGSSAKEMPFLLGLDMMKRHTATIDLAQHCLRFRISGDQFMEVPFLHEKDLDAVTQGGTRGFDAAKANRELMELDEKEEDEDEANKKPKSS